jgi:hypothetical protein
MQTHTKMAKMLHLERRIIQLVNIIVVSVPHLHELTLHGKMLNYYQDNYMHEGLLLL